MIKLISLIKFIKSPQNIENHNIFKLASGFRDICGI